MIVDLRDYQLNPGCRSKMIERFESVTMDAQEQLGATLLGNFLDADDENRWVWLRACPDLAARQRILTAFYTDGELWKRQRDEINGWIADSDNVLLIRPISEVAAPASGASTVGMYTHIGSAPLAPEAAAKLDREVTSAIAAAGGRVLVTFATDAAENNYPRHAIRTGEHGLVWFATFATYRPLTIANVRQRRLIPTARSRMR